MAKKKELKPEIEDVVEEEKDQVEEVELEEKDPIEELNKEITDLKDKLLRNQAELENFKKRTNEERMKERKYAHSGIFMTLLDVVDNFERATAGEIKEDSLKNYVQGFKMIENQLKEILKNNGVTEIEALDKPFDEKEHQSIMLGEDESKESNIVLEVIQKGYKYKDRILRPAMVKVNK